MQKDADVRFDGEAFTEDHELLGEHDEPAPRERRTTSQKLLSWIQRYQKKDVELFPISTWLGSRSHLCLLVLGLLLGLTIAFLSLLAYTFGAQQTIATLTRKLHHGSNDYPFSGAFARFPRLSALEPRQRRLTAVMTWNDDGVTSYLRHAYYTAQRNADVMDVLLLNRIRTPGGKCLNFEENGLDITWGGNIKHVCIDDTEWKQRHANFVCSKQYGWDCTEEEYDAVLGEFEKRPDDKNYNWRPFQGWVFRDLFPNPENPFWAWMDEDSFIGDFRRYPFNLLSQLSILSGGPAQPKFLMMAGQLTAFNFDDPDLGSAWQKFPPLKTPTHFTNYTEMEMPRSSEERYWSYGYMNSDEDLPGHKISFGLYPDRHGDDYFSNQWGRKEANETYLVSGRDILLASTNYDRKSIEALIQMEREIPIDDLGGVGWTTGEDGSEYLIEDPNLPWEEAKARAMEDTHGSAVPHVGIVDDVKITPGPKKHTQQIPNDDLTKTPPPILRTSVVRFKEQQPGHVLRRMERDSRPRGYQRKLIRHHLKSKKLEWWSFPPFDITDDLVMVYNYDSIEVFKMGESRNQTIFHRSANNTIG